MRTWAFIKLEKEEECFEFLNYMNHWTVRIKRTHWTIRILIWTLELYNFELTELLEIAHVFSDKHKFSLAHGVCS